MDRKQPRPFDHGGDSFQLHGERRKTVEERHASTNHAMHETLEITQGINDWSEVGFYVFTSIQPNEGWQWVAIIFARGCGCRRHGIGPVGVSLSTEIGYQRPAFSPDTWTWEIRPIIR